MVWDGLVDVAVFWDVSVSLFLLSDELLWKRMAWGSVGEVKISDVLLPSD